MVKRRAFTDSFLRSLKAPGDEPLTRAGQPYKLAEHAPKGEGRLVIRVSPARPGSDASEPVKEFFYRYRANGKDKSIALGRFDPAGRNGKALGAVREELRGMRKDQLSTGDVKEHRAKVKLAREEERRRGTFKQLLESYAAHLQLRKSPSAAQVAGIFRRHVYTDDATSSLKASAVAPGHIQAILGRLVKAGLTRQVNKTRAYLRAAFAFGMASDYDPRTTAVNGVLFGIRENPAAALKPIREYEQTRERVLFPDELRGYWSALDALPIVQRCTLRLNLALACQRPTQLLRADWPDFDFVQATVLLRDSKGRGGSRDHLLPLTAFALEQLQPLRAMNAAAAGPFSADGKRRMSVETLSAAVAGISRGLPFPPFQQRDLRRTAETMLQKLGIDREVRAHLLSHGRSQGVQGRHYERYDFLKEKRAALEKWAEHLARILHGNVSAKVVNLR